MDVLLTIEEAATWLDPPVTAAQLKHLVQATELQPQGVRYTGRPGRPGSCYPMSQLQLVHAAYVTLMARLGGVNAGLAQGPAKVPS